MNLLCDGMKCFVFNNYSRKIISLYNSLPVYLLYIGKKIIICLLIYSSLLLMIYILSLSCSFVFHLRVNHWHLYLPSVFCLFFSVCVYIFFHEWNVQPNNFFYLSLYLRPYISFFTNQCKRFSCIRVFKLRGMKKTEGLVGVYGCLNSKSNHVLTTFFSRMKIQTDPISKFCIRVNVVVRMGRVVSYICIQRRQDGMKDRVKKIKKD